MTLNDQPRAQSPDKRLVALAKDAILVQDACNPLGLTKGFAQATQDLCDVLRELGLPSDTAALCRHPVFRLWASKMYDLARLDHPASSEVWSVAYNACKVQAGIPVTAPTNEE